MFFSNGKNKENIKTFLTSGDKRKKKSLYENDNNNNNDDEDEHVCKYIGKILSLYLYNIL